MKKLLIIAMLCLCAQVGYAMNDKEIDELFFSDHNRNNVDIIIDSHELAALPENNNQLNLICTTVKPINNYAIPEDNHNNNDDNDDEQPSGLVKRTINSHNQHVRPTRNKNYTSASSLMKIHAEERPYKCDHPGCGYAARFKSNLAVHMMVHTEERPYKCDHPGCTYTAKLKSSVTRHMMRHTGERRYKCEHPGCTYAAARKESLVTHMITHTGERPFSCTHPGCTYACAFKSNLTMHMTRHTRERPFSCTHPGCTYASAIEATLRRHMKVKHSNMARQES